jgi:hypothetical protein
MYGQPLSDCLRLTDQQDLFPMQCTALWRGYIGTWELDDDRLYLLSLDVPFSKGASPDMSRIFPHASGRVFADWFSGTLMLPQGERIERIHHGDGGRCERELRLTFEKGRLTGLEQLENAIVRRSRGGLWGRIWQWLKRRK